MDELLHRLEQHQQLVLNELDTCKEPDYRLQYHPDLSPLGWHIGHCVYTETYWIREAWLAKDICTESIKALYIPELCKKSERSQQLPEKQQLLDWAAENQRKNKTLLGQHCLNKSDHELMKNNFLIHFLIQHYAQHFETIQMIKQARCLLEKTEYQVGHSLLGKPVETNILSIAAGKYDIGNASNETYYDNEKPFHRITLNDVAISQKPVSNAEFLYFMEQGGYKDESLWSEEGWRWVKENKIEHPHHWQQDSTGNWFGVGIDDSCDLPADQAVSGVSYFEAEALSRFAKARLPHEHEWEVACRDFGMGKTHEVWEWCRNAFQPYDGFKAFPYEGYSTPYFDKQHFVIRGGSEHTRDIIRRVSFRNYYLANKRHIFAGVRLAWDK